MLMYAHKYACNEIIVQIVSSFSECCNRILQNVEKKKYIYIYIIII